MLVVKDIDLYYGASQALKHVSIQAEIGKVTTVLGRNGVGKTSLLKAIVGQQAIASGSVSWLDKDISKYTPPQRGRSGIAYVPQGREIFPLLTVKENLETAFAAVSSKDKYISEEIFELFPVLKDMQKRRGGDLSGGQQQQLAIARALTMRPQLLVLDEPTEGIQPSIIKDIGRIIALLRDRGDMAILLVEQYYEFARDLANDFYVLDRGEVVLSGDIEKSDEEEIMKYLTV